MHGEFAASTISEMSFMHGCRPMSASTRGGSSARGTYDLLDVDRHDRRVDDGGSSPQLVSDFGSSISNDERGDCSVDLSGAGGRPFATDGSPRSTRSCLASSRRQRARRFVGGGALSGRASSDASESDSCTPPPPPPLELPALCSPAGGSARRASSNSSHVTTRAFGFGGSAGADVADAGPAERVAEARAALRVKADEVGPRARRPDVMRAGHISPDLRVERTRRRGVRSPRRPSTRADSVRRGAAAPDGGRLADGAGAARRRRMRGARGSRGGHGRGERLVEGECVRRDADEGRGAVQAPCAVGRPAEHAAHEQG